MSAIFDGCLDPGPEFVRPAGVHACATTRVGGRSRAPYATLDLGGERDADENPAPAVLRNREALRAALGLGRICFLEQVHGCAVHRVGRAGEHGAAADADVVPMADATVIEQPGVAACVLTADCLPVLFAHRSGQIVGAAHAGWRGLAAGVLEQTLTAMAVPAEEVSVWLGPAIGPAAFEVGPEVREAFLSAERARAGGVPDTAVENAFTPGAGDRWHADLWALARHRLGAAGVTQIGGGGIDVHGCPSRFYSWRRDAGRTGRQATLIWISPNRRS